MRSTARPLLILLFLLGVVACQTVPLTNRSQLLLIPEGTELQMGLTSYQEITRDDAGLAAVLGHEVAHALARRDAVTTQWITAGLGAGATVGLLLPWSRQQESEADHLGLIHMARAGYHPQVAHDLWVRMASQGGARQPR